MMALADYRLCDVCGCKAFYDANLNYEFEETEWNAHRGAPFRVAGEEQNADPELNKKYGTRLDYVGDWAVVCIDCSDKYETKIVERAAQQSKGEKT